MVQTLPAPSSALFDRLLSVFLKVFYCHPSSEFPPHALAAASSFPTITGSRFCTDFLSDPAQNLSASGYPLRQLRHSPLPAGTLPPHAIYWPETVLSVHPQPPPVYSWAVMQTARRCPFAPRSLQTLPHYYEQLCPGFAHRYSHTHNFGYLYFSLDIATTGSRSSCKEPDTASCLLYAGHLSRSIRNSPVNLSRRYHHASGFDAS